MNANLIFPFRRRWPILLIVPLLSVAFAIAITPRQAEEPPRWEAGIYLAADSSQANTVQLKQASIDVKQPKVAELAAEKMGEEIKDPKRFAAPLKVRALEESLTIRLSVVDEDKEWAPQYVTAFAEALIETNLATLNEEYVAELETLQESRDKARDEVLAFQIENRGALGVDPVLNSRQTVLEQRLDAAERELIDWQETPVESPYRIQDADETTLVPQSKLELPSSRPVRAALALMLGLIGGIALAAFVERLNPRVDKPADAERIVGAPVLAMVPIMKGKRRDLLERADLAEFSGPFAESFRAMRSHLDFRSTVEGLDRPPCVMIVSSAPGEGKTTSTAFLGLSYAEVGREVVVVGGDFRRPAVHRLFGVPRSPGLSTRLLSNDPETRSEGIVSNIVKRDPQTGVRIIPSGPGTDRVTGLLSDLQAVTTAGLDSGCTVVIDTAPVMVANDAIDYLPIVDWVILVVRLGRTTERSLKQTVASLELNNAKIAGVIMVGSLEASDAKRYYYSYYKVDEDAETLAQRQIDESRRGRRGARDDEAVVDAEAFPAAGEAPDTPDAEAADAGADDADGDDPLASATVGPEAASEADGDGSTTA